MEEKDGKGVYAAGSLGSLLLQRQLYMKCDFYNHIHSYKKIVSSMLDKKWLTTFFSPVSNVLFL